MTYDFTPLKKKTKETEDWLKKELAQIRTGRAAPTLLDAISVDAYGAKTPLNQVGSVTIEDPRTLRVSVWDASQIKAVEKAIGAANIGVGTAVDERGVRVTFPELTGERRQAVLKIAKERLEQARVTLRKARDEAWADIQKREKEGGMSEDEKFRFKGDMEKVIQDAGKALDVQFEKKEKEISG
jgi:ribosome recycling factor